MKMLKRKLKKRNIKKYFPSISHNNIATVYHNTLTLSKGKLRYQLKC